MNAWRDFLALCETEAARARCPKCVTAHDQAQRYAFEAAVEIASGPNEGAVIGVLLCRGCGYMQCVVHGCASAQIPHPCLVRVVMHSGIGPVVAALMKAIRTGDVTPAIVKLAFVGSRPC